MADPAKPTGNWSDAFPAPRTTAPFISPEEALSDLSSPDLLIVDVRRNDYEGGAVRGSINLPAQSFYMNRGVLYQLCACNGRGPRCSGWFADYIAEKGDDDIKSLTLAGGIKGWVKGGDMFTQQMDGFEPEYWKQFE
ncbi:Rhodanese domain containing protein [Pyrenophora tritici-repentis]|uniref:Rhodanese domain containing protein n=1 Tax=Pyrenophora tritici-repentis TaxID=45151 RepID=A0A2W1FEP5_9PLEO|nr:Rhodanese domain containing protein [Pyrenophora tritici-repentis]KAF7567430.1 Rhodanese domain containing protein [Pyrenophora tritici-repentis]KAI1515358.1 Rhodanese domain containing protein [Pyrenophora tritici-repentis]KAI1544932.1 Rhodanese domain containing protein [Pyrenophora tritici-repentis]KAI1575823.1 Rhodanese domain containing protein [Pyrenophora tritici-repentis]